MKLRSILLGLLLCIPTLSQAAYVPPNPNGQATMANSTPVVLPSNQSAIPVTLSSTTVTNTVNIVDPDGSTSGTISAADVVVGAPAGTGVPLSGASTAGSIVALQSPGGDTAWNLQLSGTFGGTTVYYEESLDSTNGTDGSWIAVNGRQTGVVNTVLGNSTTVAGYFRGNTSGSTWMRARAVGGSAISLTAKIRISAGVGAVFLNASVPAGSNNIGSVTVANASLPVTGTFWQATQPVSAASLPLPTGASTEATISTLNGKFLLAGSTSASNETLTERIKVDGSLRLLDIAQTSGSQLVTAKGDQTSGMWVNVKNTPAVTLASTTLTGTSAISAASLPLPTGASTETTLAALNTKYPAAAASTDGLANPTVTQVGVTSLLFNGTTWDRQRGNFDTTTGDTGAKTVTFTGAAQTNYNARGAVITILLGTVTGTTPTLVAQLQYSYDGGTTFAAFSAANTAVTATGNTIQFVVYPTASNNAATGATQQIITNAALPRKWRVAYTIGGTTPSFTITNVYINYIL